MSGRFHVCRRQAGTATAFMNHVNRMDDFLFLSGNIHFYFSDEYIVPGQLKHGKELYPEAGA